ncbi:ECF transporter S component [Candidatus Bathyarchaeota archaeon]|nr:ECF transporter S component [Candidatus Bathyarchaeota archaeon]
MKARMSIIPLSLAVVLSGLPIISRVLPMRLPLPVNWAVVSASVAVLAVAAVAMEFEGAPTGSKEVALVAVLGTLSALSRIPFAAIPSVQPCTYLVICAGYVLGPVQGFMTGVMTALISNLMLGLGPWTPYQMVAWGSAGLVSHLFRRGFKGRSILPLVALGALWGFVFGAIMNLWFWTAYVYPLNPATFAATMMSSLWLDAMHSLGNIFFLSSLGGRTIRILERFQDRFQLTLL